MRASVGVKTNLVLLGGGALGENKALAKRALESLKGKNATIAFVPAHAEDAAIEFRDFRRALGIKARFRCFPLQKALSPAQKKALLSADAIFLGGGNTYHFLQKLRRQGLSRALRNFTARGGLLMGVSAGGILFTPSIRTAAVPSLDADENRSRVTDLRAMALVPFDFSPHYVAHKQVNEELLEYSKRLRRPIVACPDGAAVLVRDGKISFVGRNVRVFYAGRTLRRLPRA